MMKVTRTTFGQIAANRREKLEAKAPKLQRLLKNGSWGKPFPVMYAGSQDPVEYMEKLNPGQTFRIAQ